LDVGNLDATIPFEPSKVKLIKPPSPKVEFKPPSPKLQDVIEAEIGSLKFQIQDLTVLVLNLKRARKYSDSPSVKEKRCLAAIEIRKSEMTTLYYDLLSIVNDGMCWAWPQMLTNSKICLLRV